MPDLAQRLQAYSLMKILISTDIEGVAGVFHPEQTRAGNGEYEARAPLDDARGQRRNRRAPSRAAPARCWVNDSHGGFRNLLPDLLDARAQVVLGKPRYLGMMAGSSTARRCVCMVGYHARAQSRGILAHTINSFAFARVALNGVEAGRGRPLRRAGGRVRRAGR